MSKRVKVTNLFNEPGEVYTFIPVHETKDAFKVNDGERDIWLPRSAVSVESRLMGQYIKLWVPDWLANEKGLIS